MRCASCSCESLRSGAEVGSSVARRFQRSTIAGAASVATSHQLALSACRASSNRPSAAGALAEL
jgi:hypothetical protein